MNIPSQLNHYEILKSLGRGGMGEVFLAEDTRLRRKVALKIVTSEAANDPDRRRAIEREALAAAALNHPNIVTIHAVDEVDGLPFIVMEFVEGQTLAELLRDKPLTLEAILRIGAAVCAAIAAAHERQIIHRDLKPQNVMVTRAGWVKVLDFGLAKLRVSQPSDDTVTATASQHGADRIVGTVAYMSPEQAEGKPVDGRSDVFSLGVMLHEMATGERPFKGDTTVSLISSILRDTPPSISQLNPALPPRLGRIVTRALAKDAAQRYQHALDLRNDLEDLRAEVSGGSPADGAKPPLVRRGPMSAWAIAAALLVVVAAALGAYTYSSRRQTGETSIEIAGMSRLTSTGVAMLGAISPDGRYVVHVKREARGPALWVRQTATMSDVQIVPPADGQFVGMTFSRDGNYVYYTAAVGSMGSLYRVPVLGGAPQLVLENIDSRATLSPDGRQLAFMRGSPNENQTYLMVGNVDGTKVRALSRLEEPYQFEADGVAWSPDGSTLLATGRSVEGGPHDIPFRVDVATGAAAPVGERWALANELEWLPDGRAFLLVGADFNGTTTGLWQVTFPGGARRPVTNDLARYHGISVSSDGRALTTMRVESDSSIWVAPAGAPASGRRILEERGSDLSISGVAWTPDGRIVYPSTKSGRYQLWIAQSDGTGARQLTDVPIMSLSPSISFDGTTVFFENYDARRIALASMSIDGSRFREIVTGAVRSPKVSPDGKWLYYADSGRGTDQLYRVALAGGRPERLSDEVFSIHELSHDGSKVIGMSWNKAQARFNLAVLPIGGGSVRHLTRPGVGAAFTPDGESIIYLSLGVGAQMQVVRESLHGGPPTVLGDIPEFAFAWDLSADGQRIVLVRVTSRSDIVVLSVRAE